MELDQWKDIWKEEGEQPSNDAQKLSRCWTKNQRARLRK